jgi:[ribosomal protein S18]-alanine N-acetyltransferase
VRASNAGAIALYKLLGFVEAGRRPRYYQDPQDDAVLMRLTLI